MPLAHAQLDGTRERPMSECQPRVSSAEESTETTKKKEREVETAAGGFEPAVLTSP